MLSWLGAIIRVGKCALKFGDCKEICMLLEGAQRHLHCHHKADGVSLDSTEISHSFVKLCLSLVMILGWQFGS